MRIVKAMRLVAGFGVVLACAGNSINEPGENGLPACTGNAQFTVSPVVLSDIVGWVPLGNLNPSAHTFPTNHQYLYHTNPNGGTPHTVQVVAPAAITITRARQTSYSPDGHKDHSVSFAVCKEISGEFGHVATIDPTILAQLGAFDQHCDTYSPAPGSTVTSCEAHPSAIAITAGATIGTAGGTAGLYGLDFSLWDSRVPDIVYANPLQWNHNSDGMDDYHVVAASDYYAEPLKSQIAAKLGTGDGTSHRTIPPLGGTVAVDRAGTAQGHWFYGGLPHYPESPHLALVPDNVDPTRVVLSVGTSQTGLPSGYYRYTPALGTTNTAATDITADGQVRCIGFNGTRIVLLQLTDATTLKVEARAAASCASQLPWTFTGAVVEYRR